MTTTALRADLISNPNDRSTRVSSWRGARVPTTGFRGTVTTVTSNGIVCTGAPGYPLAMPVCVIVVVPDTAETVRTPYGIAIPGLRPRTVETGAAVHIEDSVLGVGSWTRSLAASPVWYGSVPILTDDALQRLARQKVYEHPFQLDAETRALRCALAAGDVDAITHTATMLIGLGPGLTPSGDDVLVGMLAVLQSAAPSALSPAAHSALITSIEAALHRTSAFSAWRLWIALSGAFDETVVEMLSALNVSDLATAQAAMRLGSAGATSGADVLAGMTACALALTNTGTTGSWVR